MLQPTLIRLALLAALLLSACAAQPEPPRPTRAVPTLLPTVPSFPTVAPPAADGPSDSGWLVAEDGVELRRMRVAAGGEREPFPLTLVRLDPARVQLRVAFDPAAPRALSAWFDERRPILAVNGGFFTESYQPTALLISDGAASGESYQGFGGMLTVSPGGEVALWALRDTPYDPASPVAQGLQSFPMLLFPGGVPADLEDNGQRARRTAVGLDRAGRIVFVVAPTSALTLPELAAWLARSDLELDRALNLDGGSSTGLFLSAGALSESIDSFGPLPIVILAAPRS